MTKIRSMYYSVAAFAAIVLNAILFVCANTNSCWMVYAGEPKQTSHSLYQQNNGLHSPAMYVAGVFIVMVLDIYHIKRDDTMRCTIEQDCPYL